MGSLALMTQHLADPVLCDPVVSFPDSAVSLTISLPGGRGCGLVAVCASGLPAAASSRRRSTSLGAAWPVCPGAQSPQGPRGEATCAGRTGNRLDVKCPWEEKLPFSNPLSVANALLVLGFKGWGPF